MAQPPVNARGDEDPNGPTVMMLSYMRSLGMQPTPQNVRTLQAQMAHTAPVNITGPGGGHTMGDAYVEDRATPTQPSGGPGVGQSGNVALQVESSPQSDRGTPSRSRQTSAQPNQTSAQPDAGPSNFPGNDTLASRQPTPTPSPQDDIDPSLIPTGGALGGGDNPSLGNLGALIISGLGGGGALGYGVRRLMNILGGGGGGGAPQIAGLLPAPQPPPVPQQPTYRYDPATEPLQYDPATGTVGPRPPEPAQPYEGIGRTIDPNNPPIPTPNAGAGPAPPPDVPAARVRVRGRVRAPTRIVP